MLLIRYKVDICKHLQVTLVSKLLRTRNLSRKTIGGGGHRDWPISFFVRSRLFRKLVSSYIVDRTHRGLLPRQLSNRPSFSTVRSLPSLLFNSHAVSSIIQLKKTVISRRITSLLLLIEAWKKLRRKYNFVLNRGSFLRLN